MCSSTSGWICAFAASIAALCGLRGCWIVALGGDQRLQDVGDQVAARERIGVHRVAHKISLHRGVNDLGEIAARQHARRSGRIRPQGGRSILAGDRQRSSMVAAEAPSAKESGALTGAGATGLSRVSPVLGGTMPCGAGNRGAAVPHRQALAAKAARCVRRAAFSRLLSSNIVYHRGNPKTCVSAFGSAGDRSDQLFEFAHIGLRGAASGNG